MKYISLSKEITCDWLRKHSTSRRCWCCLWSNRETMSWYYLLKELSEFDDFTLFVIFVRFLSIRLTFSDVFIKFNADLERRLRLSSFVLTFSKDPCWTTSSLPHCCSLNRFLLTHFCSITLPCTSFSSVGAVRGSYWLALCFITMNKSSKLCCRCTTSCRQVLRIATLCLRKRLSTGKVNLRFISC